MSKGLPFSSKFYVTLWISCTLAILYGTLYPNEMEFPREIWTHDKFVHFIMFFTWTLFLGIVQMLRNSFGLLRLLLWSLVFGAAVEMLQFILPINRSAEFLDILADFLGSVTAALLLFWYYKKNKDTE